MKAEDYGYKSVEEMELHNEVLSLFMDCMVEKPLLMKFFDRDSHELLEKKKEVLKKIKSGKDVPDKEFYSILEKYPKGHTNWEM